METEGTTIKPAPSPQVVSGLRDLRQRIGARQETAALPAPTKRRETNQELLQKALTAACPRERDRAAETLRRQIKSLCAAVIDRYAGSRLSAQEVEDLAQEVLLRLLTTGKEDAVSAVTVDPSPAYVTRIAVNLLIDRQRFQKRRGLNAPAVSLDDSYEAASVPDTRLSVEEDVVTRLYRTELRASLKRTLNPMEAEVVWRRSEGATHQEIAAELGIQQANARKHCERGLKRLKHLIETGALSIPLSAPREEWGASTAAQHAG